MSPVSCSLKFREAKKTCHRLVRTSVWPILYYYTAGSDKSDVNERVPDRFWICLWKSHRISFENFRLTAELLMSMTKYIGFQYLVTFRSLWMTSSTVDLGISVSRPIGRTVRWVQGWSSWLNTSCSMWQTFPFVLTVRLRPLPRTLAFEGAVRANFCNNFFKPDCVHDLLGNSAISFF